MRHLDHTVTLKLADAAEVQLDSDKKLKLIKERLRSALVKRVRLCREEAEGLQNDMAIAAERLDQDTIMAEIDSVRVAGYHINQTELLVLRRVWVMVNSIIGGNDCKVDGEEDDE